MNNIYSWPIIKKLISSANFDPSGGKPCPLPTSGSDASAATSRQQMRRRRWSWYWMSSSARWEELGESRWLGFLGKIMENVHIRSVNSNFTWKFVLNDLNVQFWIGNQGFFLIICVGKRHILGQQADVPSHAGSALVCHEYKYNRWLRKIMNISY